LRVVRISDFEVKKDMPKVFEFVIENIKNRERELKFPS